MSVVKDVEIMHQGVIFKLQIKLTAVDQQQPPPPPPEQSIDELKIVKITTSGDDGNKGENMLSDNVDRWSCKGKECTAVFDLGGIQQVGEVFLRFYKDAERTESFELSLSEDNKNWLAKLTSEQQEQGGVVLSINPFFNARYVKFTGQGNSVNEWNSVEYVKISGKKLSEPTTEPEPTPEPPTPEPPTPTPEPTGELDKFGVKKIRPDMPNGKWFDNPSYKRSEHNTGTRDTFSMEVGPLLNMEATGYFTIKATKESEELSIKIFGGGHGDDNPKQGRCYGLGVGFSGRPQIYKEYPQHPEGGKHLEKAKFGDLGESIGKILERNIGLKIISYVQGSTPSFECWIDNEGIKDGKPTNDWKLFYSCEDKGDWDGEAYTENQGIKNGGKGLYYVRIDTVTDKTVADFISVREIDTTGSISGPVALEAQAIEDTKKVAELAT